LHDRTPIAQFCFSRKAQVERVKEHHARVGQRSVAAIAFRPKEQARLVAGLGAAVTREQYSQRWARID
jgi:hypothetical protein